jgi:hypothetical protein
MLLRTLAGSACLVAALAADTVVLKSGRRVEGDYLGGDARRVRVAVRDSVETFDVSDISEIRFGTASAPESSRSAATAAKPAQEPVLRPAPVYPDTRATAAKPGSIEIPAGTAIVVRMIDDVDSEKHGIGETFQASIDEPVTIEGTTVLPRGANVAVKLVAEKQSGQLTGRTMLTLDLVSVEVNGKMADVITEEVTQQSASRTDRTGKVVGGTAALGAIIGAIAGGGKGAAIGAVSGAAAGGAVQVMTKGERVRIPSETRLTFMLKQPLRA